MKTNELEKILENMTGKSDNGRQVRAIAHWLNRIKHAPDGVYKCYEDEEVPSLLKISELGVITLTEGEKDERIGTVHVRLTHAGEQLLDEFTKTGFFVKN